MKITLLAIGKLKTGPEAELVAEYRKRLSWSVGIREYEAKAGLKGAAKQQKEHELLNAAIPDGAYIIALDERGKAATTQQFAALLEAQQHAGQEVCFILGGADGLTDAMRQHADRLISFGAMTWPHKLARAMLCEQLYRAESLLKGHPYHRE